MTIEKIISQHGDRICIKCGTEFDPLWEGNLAETLCHECEDDVIDEVDVGFPPETI